MARDIERFGIVDRVVAEVLSGDALERITDRLLSAGVAERVAGRV